MVSVLLLLLIRVYFFLLVFFSLTGLVFWLGGRQQALSVLMAYLSEVWQYPFLLWTEEGRVKMLETLNQLRQ